jgi:pimeloyl-ACP methyl ester carboxylesterase
VKLTRGKTLCVRYGLIGKFIVALLFAALVSCSGKGTQPPSSPTSLASQVPTSESRVTSTVETPVPTATATKVTDAIPRFEPGDCAAPLTIGLRHRCGWLVVLEDRTKPDGRLLRLPVLIFEARSSEPRPDPVIYLAGGGGVNQMAMMSLYSDFVSAVVSERDFIMYNQRGSPLTDPALECAGLEDVLWELAELNAPIEERNQRLAEFWTDCRSELAAQGVDLNMYSTSANAADANDLRIALGYERANYYGTSYGTRIGLLLLRDWSDGVRSIILDSAYPPEADYYTTYATHVARALTTLFDECNSDPACVERHGDIEMLFAEAVDQLDSDPQIIVYADGRVVVDGMMFIDVLYALLQSTPGRQEAPSFIEAASKGDLLQFRHVFPMLFDYPGSMAVYYSFQCREEVPKHSFDEVIAQAAEIPARISDYAVQFFAALDYAVCEVWGVQPSEAGESAPVESDVPTLVLAGSVDPITPAYWGRSAAENLRNGWFYELPGEAHGTMRTSACAREIALTFLENPSAQPDATCIENSD